MNYDNDSAGFAKTMKTAWQSFGRTNLTADTLRLWFEKLSQYEFNEVENAFDVWIINQKELPTLSDILKLCQHKVTIHSRPDSPLSKQANAEYAKEVVDFVAKQPKQKRDYKGWARKILQNTKSYPDIAIRLAQEALNSKEA